MFVDEETPDWIVEKDEVVAYCLNPPIQTSKILSEIKNFALTLVSQFNCDANPEIKLSNPSHDSTIEPHLGVTVLFSSSQKYSISFSQSPRKFCVFLRVLEIITECLKKRIQISKRGIFYRDVPLFKNQDIVNSTINDIARLLEVPRYHLGVIACPKGFVAGPLQFFEDGEFIDCSSRVVQIPSRVDSISRMKTNAIALIVVEKETVFMQMIQSSIVNEIIIVTGRGMPDFSTRLFLKLIEDCFDFPILGLFDPDAYGIFMAFIYRFGSKQASYDGLSMAVSRMFWLGVRPSDLELIQRSRLIELNDKDRKILNKMLEEEFLPEEWKDEIRLLCSENLKGEIESLLSHGIDELVDVYLPNKFERQDWI